MKLREAKEDLDIPAYKKTALRNTYSGEAVKSLAKEEYYELESLGYYLPYFNSLSEIIIGVYN